MEKKEEQKENRFTYSDDKGLTILSEQDILDSIENEFKKKDVKKSQSTEQIKGGKSDGMLLQDIANKHKVDIKEIKKEFKKGIEVEMEHTDDPKVATEVAMDHLYEFSNYYSELDKMEQSLKEEEKDK